MFPSRLILSFIILLIGSATALAGGQADISRSYGPFHLGMSESAFAKLTGIAPNQCPICLEKETFVALSEHQLQQQGIDDRNTNGVDFFFLDGSLYLISRTPQTMSLFNLKEDISSLFGLPDSEDTGSKGVSALIWKDNSTEISINYSDINHEIFSLNIKDRLLGQEKASREAVLLEQMSSNP